MTVNNAWCGAPEPGGFAVASRHSATPSSAQLHVSTSADLSGATVHQMTLAANRCARIRLTGLTAATRYYWGVAENGGAVAVTGTARTAPATSGSFTFWSSSCAETGSTSPVFDAIRNLNPDFGLHMGDIHYRDIGTNDVILFQDAYDQVLASTPQHALYRNVPIVYVWDDHDYGPNDSSYYSSSRTASLTAYRERVPHYPLPDSEGIWQTFTYGRVRFIMLDPRAYRGQTSGSMLGTTQKQWFKDTLTAADEPLVIISTGVPWLGTVTDTWGSYATERDELATWLVDNGWKDRVIFVGGDQHALAYDDGTNNTYGGLNAPVFQTASLDRTGSNKGGTYTRPVVSGAQKFGLWTVTDDGGDTISVDMQAYSSGSVLYTETVTFTATPAQAEQTVRFRIDRQDRTMVRARLNGVDRTVASYRLV